MSGILTEGEKRDLPKDWAFDEIADFLETVDESMLDSPNISGTLPDEARNNADFERFTSFREKKEGVVHPVTGERLKLPYEDRRAIAMAKGTEVEYLGCVMCGLNRPIPTKPRSGRDMTRFKVNTDKVLQIRKGGGRGIGFFLLKQYGLKAIRDHRPDIYQNLKEVVTDLALKIKEVDKL